MGTGSGILSIAAAKLGCRQVTAFDVDEEAVEAAKENAAILNEAQSLINESLRKGDKDGAATIYQQFSGRLEQMGVTGLTLDPVLDDGDADE